MIDVGSKVKIKNTDQIGTVKEIRYKGVYDYSIRVQIGVGWDYYKIDDLEIIEEVLSKEINNKGEKKMRILEIPVKFEKGDTIYTTKQINEEKVCHICEGKKTITYNDKPMRCPECMGKGKFPSNKKVHVVLDEPFKISTIKISLDSDEKPSIRYHGRCGFDSVRRAEENLFLTKEEAQNRCNELNQERIFIDLDNIIIQDSFKENQPSLDKITERLNYYKEHGKFQKEIIIDKDNVLLDGYITYSICKLLNLNHIKVTVAETPVIGCRI